MCLVDCVVNSNYSQLLYDYFWLRLSVGEIELLLCYYELKQFYKN